VRKRAVCPVSVLLALGVSAQCTHAQSSVTLYGLIDTSIEITNPGSSWTPRLDSGAFRGSRVGLRGEEQIGSDTRILFDLENGFNSADGALATSGTLFNRQAWIGVGAPWGEVRLGRQYSPIYIPFKGELDAFGAGTIASGLNNLSKITPYTNNGLAYLSPDLHGFTTTLMVALPNSGNGNGLSGNYETFAYRNGPPAPQGCARISAACRTCLARRPHSSRSSTVTVDRRVITTTACRCRRAMPSRHTSVPRWDTPICETSQAVTTMSTSSALRANMTSRRGSCCTRAPACCAIMAALNSRYAVSM
jgi:hypothetical protein